MPLRAVHAWGRLHNLRQSSPVEIRSVSGLMSARWAERDAVRWQMLRTRSPSPIVRNETMPSSRAVVKRTLKLR